MNSPDRRASTSTTEAAQSRTFLRIALASFILFVVSLPTASFAQPPIPGAGNAALPPPPPLPTSPVATFRHLLALPPAERANALALRPERQRAFLQTRLAAYEAMTPEVREERLHATDLYWHLQQLIRRAPSERAALLAAAPPNLQSTLNLRLALWDRLPETDRTALLEHEGAIRYFAQMRSASPPPLPPSPTAASTSPGMAAAPQVPLRIQADLAKLNQFTHADLDRIQENWRRFFEGSAPNRQRALQEMPAEERQEMEQVLERFRRLTPDQRRSCVGSFTRLASMAPVERSEFLRHAERWEALPSSERQAWRQIVNKLPLFPPLPTQATQPPLPLPPTPRRLATNAGAP